ncbi:MAG: hypothetical protein IKP64_00020 [Selenomonadaceae bacterium]|nr:hypothetical protein [Selenomonadaceae bacterium]MBR4381920.1 hypothetical protein [Selenomonadaceae bacterium]
MFGFLGAVISGLSSALSVVGTLVPKIVGIVGAALQKLSTALEVFFKVLGLLAKDETMEDIGDRALQAEQDEQNPIKIEDFDSHEKYLAAIREYEVDPEKSALTTEDEKLHKAIEIMLAAAMSQYGQPMTEFGQIVMNNPEFYGKSERLAEFANIARSDPQTFADIVNYIEHKVMSTEKNDAAFDKLIEMERKVNPDAPDEEIWSVVSDMKK